jgi:5-methylthioribose kinase
MDIEVHKNLKKYLREKSPIPVPNIAGIKNLSGGVSNKTVQVFFEDGSSWVIKQALEKLRVKGDWFSDPDRIFFEAAAMSWLQKRVRIAKLIFEDQAHHLLVMEGIATPFENLKNIFMKSGPSPMLIQKAGEMLGEIHGTEVYELPELLMDNRFFISLRIEPYYQEVIRKEPSTKVFLDHLIEETYADRFSFTHGDYSPKNFLVRNDDLILLDHEVAHFGDGTFDLGFFFTHLVSKANHIPEYRQQFIDGLQIFYDSYHKKNEIDKQREARVIRHTIGCLLARVKGLSPLEYLTEDQKGKQLQIGLQLIDEVPLTLDHFVLRIKELLNDQD